MQLSAADAKAKLRPARSTPQRNVLPPPAAGWRQRDLLFYEPINLAKTLIEPVDGARVVNDWSIAIMRAASGADDHQDGRYRQRPHVNESETSINYIAIAAPQYRRR
jgi:hypothetical protein